MKQTTCRDLRGVCDTKITGNTAEEMAQNSKNHVMEMIGSGDEAHKEAIADMQQLSPEEQQQWYGEFVASFDSLPEA